MPRFGSIPLSMYSGAFRHALRYWVETWRRGRGQPPKVCGHIFQFTSPKVKGHPDVNLPLKCPMATKFCQRTHWRLLRSRRVFRDQPGVKLLTNALRPPNFGRKKHWSELKHCWGQKVTQWSSGVNQRTVCYRNVLRPPGVVIRTTVQSKTHFRGQKLRRGHQGVIKGQTA